MNRSWGFKRAYGDKCIRKEIDLLDRVKARGKSKHLATADRLFVKPSPFPMREYFKRRTWLKRWSVLVISLYRYTRQLQRKRYVFVTFCFGSFANFENCFLIKCRRRHKKFAPSSTFCTFQAHIQYFLKRMIKGIFFSQIHELKLHFSIETLEFTDQITGLGSSGNLLYRAEDRFSLLAGYRSTGRYSVRLWSDQVFLGDNHLSMTFNFRIRDWSFAWPRVQIVKAQSLLIWKSSSIWTICLQSVNV